MLNYCPKCGNKLYGDRFCPSCGADLSAYGQQEGETSIDELSAMAQKAADEKRIRDAFYADCQIENGVLVRYSGNDSVVTVPDGITEIGEHAFTADAEDIFVKNEKLTEVILPKGLKKISKDAFMNCVNLRRINIPDGVTEIGDGAFNSCDLTELYLPDSVTALGVDLLGGCKSLKKIRLPAQIREIPNGMFLLCYKLLSVFIPRSVQKIGGDAFLKSGLLDVYFEGDRIPQTDVSRLQQANGVTWHTNGISPALHFNCRE